MGKYNFDEIIDRKGTNALKYDFAIQRGRPEDVLPLWVADMDFKTAPCITERLREDIELGIFGYSESTDSYFHAVYQWMKQSFAWEVKNEWLVKTPGIVFALAMAVKAFTRPKESVMIQNPVYYPFAEVITDNDRYIVDNTLINQDGHYEIDFFDMEQKIKDFHVKLFLFCSPHNPVGRVWKEWELKKIGELCLKYNVIIVSDEIHADFVFHGNKHLVFSSIDKRFEKISVICTSPTKTFNLAGFQIANIFIADKELRETFILEKSKAGFSQVGMPGLSACQAAYEGGLEWFLQLREYLEENLLYTKEFLETELPKIKLIEPEGSYLLWLDFRAYGYDVKQLNDKITNEAKLWLDSGEIFGPCGEGFQRINIACPKKILQLAFERLKEVF